MQVNSRIEVVNSMIVVNAGDQGTVTGFQNGLVVVKMDQGGVHYFNHRDIKVIV